MTAHPEEEVLLRTYAARIRNLETSATLAANERTREEGLEVGTAERLKDTRRREWVHVEELEKREPQIRHLRRKMRRVRDRIARRRPKPGPARRRRSGEGQG